MAYNSLAAVQSRVAALLKAESWAALLRAAPYWSEIVAGAHGRAYQELVGLLQQRGFSAGQADGWDQGPGFEMSMALFYALTEGGGLHNYDDKFIRQFDRREELKNTPVSVGGEIPVPEGETPSVTTGEMAWGYSVFRWRVTGEYTGTGLPEIDQHKW